MGLPAPLRRAVLALRRATHKVVEPAAGVETSAKVALEDFGLSTRDRVDYAPSGWLDLRHCGVVDCPTTTRRSCAPRSAGPRAREHQPLGPIEPLR